jgi:pyrroloquinoline quinone (PQQ) biosynthesis protein C
MTFFNQLQQQTLNHRQNFLSIPVLQDGISGDISLTTYTAFLTQAYHHVKQTVPLLMACGGKLPERLEWLRVAIGEYIEEEMGHQEWILNDLNACGADVDKIRKSTPDSATDIMVAVAFDTIHRLNPVGFFGMVLVLEGTSIALATQAASKIQQTLNLPDPAFSYLTSHGSLDISHMQTFELLMNQLDQTDDQQAVIYTAKIMYGLYGQIFKNLPHSTS